MSDTAVEIPRSTQEGLKDQIPLAAAAAVYKKGWILAVGADGYGVMGGDDASVEFGGVTDEEVEVVTGGSAGDESINVLSEGVVEFDVYSSTLTQADLGKAVYAADNYRVDRYAQSTNKLFVGVITRIISASRCAVRLVRHQLAGTLRSAIS